MADLRDVVASRGQCRCHDLHPERKRALHCAAGRRQDEAKLLGRVVYLHTPEGVPARRTAPQARQGRRADLSRSSGNSTQLGDGVQGWSSFADSDVRLSADNSALQERGPADTAWTNGALLQILG